MYSVYNCVSGDLEGKGHCMSCVHCFLLSDLTKDVCHLTSNTLYSSTQVRANLQHLHICQKRLGTALFFTPCATLGHLFKRFFISDILSQVLSEQCILL